MPSSYIMGLSAEEPVRECRTLMDAGVLRTVHASEDELLRGGGEFESILVMSHRWEEPTTQTRPAPSSRN